MRKYQKFLEKRIQECMDENKRHLAKYSDLRVFAYNQIESLVKKHENVGRRNGRFGGQGAPNMALNNSSISVYKQMMEKERKQWNDERKRRETFL